MVNRPFAGGRLFGAVRGRPLPEWAGSFGCEAWSQRPRNETCRDEATATKARKKRGGFSLEEVEAHYLRTDRPNVYRVLTKSLPADLELIWTTDTDPAQLAFRASQDLDII